MNRKKITYETEVVTNNAVVKSNNFSSIIFRNVGGANAFVMKDISLPAKSVFSEFAFINSDNYTIETSFSIEFTGEGEKRVEIIKVIYI